MNFKIIHIGILIKELVQEREIELYRICNFMKCTEQEISEMYNMENMSTDVLLRWSKLLEYDFFRLYSQHLILYAPVRNTSYKKFHENIPSSLPQFRKNVYTKEVIDYILNKIKTGEMKKTEIIERYNIPKTTLYKWISKYKNLDK
ncbi:transposase [Empedobacter tilapiae]|uniref:Transposase n=1 Tax=Empedobacter tilapiae TaxID=2491114 RepID=A0A4Z1BQ10_9FLAO|nr:transposase [Empedobacter tilapiae]TGN24235.1 transposase [Empedobacter tilapiae]